MRCSSSPRPTARSSIIAGWAASCPAIVFHLYAAAGGVSYSDEVLDALLDLPEVAGIKVATLDSVMTFQRIAGLLRKHPGKRLITGEDRFLGYSIMMGATTALIGMGAALTDIQADLLQSHAAADWDRFHRLSAVCDEFAQATFTEPMEGYIRRMLWALAAESIIPDDSCDDPWGPSLPDSDRARVIAAVQHARQSQV